MTESQAPYVLIGSYTSPDAPNAPGRGRGVSVVRQDPASGALTPVGEPVDAVNPSYLAPHPDGRTVYAISETGHGTVRAYRFDPENGALTPTGEERSTGGAAPCHLSVEPDGRWLAVANYGSGTVSVHPIGADGAVGEAADTARHAGAGPDPDRQEGPHAHLALFRDAPHADGAALLDVADLGTDQVVTYRTDLATGALTRVSTVSAEPGTGPRHLVHHPRHPVGYLVGELDASVTVLRRGPGADAPGLRVAAKVRALAGEASGAGSMGGADYPAAVALSPCGRFLYVSNRGEDVVTAFRLGPDGTPEAVADVPTGGQVPREIRFVGDRLYAANQLSDTVVAFDVDPETGVPRPAGPVLETPTPVCLLPVPVRARG